VGGDLVEVELDDDPEPVQRTRRFGRRRAADGGRPTARRRWSARAWARVAVPLALLLAAGVGLDGAVAADLSRPSPGQVADLRAPRVVEWRADASAVLALVGDMIVLESPDGASVAARDLVDGTVRWRLPYGACMAAYASSAPDLSSTESMAAASARLLCEDVGATDGAIPTVLVAVATGTVLARLDVTPGSWGPLLSDGVAVVPTSSDQAPSEVVVYSLETGRRLWSRTIGVGSSGVTDLRDGVVVLDDPGEPGVAYDLRTGARTQAPAVSSDWVSATLPDGAQVHTRWGDDGSVVTVTEPDGAVRWRAAAVGSMVVPGGDETLVGLQLEPGGLEARRAATGEVLWTSSRRLSFRGVVAGVLQAVDWTAMEESQGADVDVALVGLDPRTGDLLWTDERSAAWSGLPVTDGTRFAVATDDAVEVLDGRSGRVVARWPVPRDRDQGASSYAVRGVSVSTSSSVASGLAMLPGGRILLARAGGVAVLGW
jgi:outer membrane protein assembly factor BamB